ncbi:MAG: hypothetical protein AVDCRST_MAG91-305 [uncultured Sphingomonadaceae bacterium]|uniref:cAMP-binding proteins - catabolite gene activator and regulatory subunit of cAMP-dependent protein kinases n=1 Tax=uncultured Sphingomonadaceae bacterium TaxID=169976 RepID=A0A6J4S683_9SPHN|nr:MAG: hypothetical protein AVDCRST_MAG91-305 [uncultured Sphingomonadaceae bacterium]
MNTASALVERLQHYLPLQPGERDALDWLERGRRRFAAHDVIVREGEISDRLYVVRSGWLHASTRLKNGDRQILRLHFPGDIMGTSSVAWGETSATITAVTDCVISDFPRAQLGRLFKTQSRLAALLYATFSVESVAMSDRLKSLGRTDAKARIATLLLEIASRLRVTNPGMTDTFDLNLTQADIGDATGLTKVHVNRTLKELDASGLIERHGRVIKILDESAMIELADYKDRHGHIATDWFPEFG